MPEQRQRPPGAYKVGKSRRLRKVLIGFLPHPAPIDAEPEVLHAMDPDEAKRFARAVLAEVRWFEKARH